MRTLIIAVAAFAMTGLTTATVHAGTPATPTAKVFYGDLNLQSASGMKTLKVRIHSAARAVCGPTASIEGGIARNQHCLRVAVAGAMKQVPDAGQQFATR